ncbi:Hsp33 family molecular chaperone HslO [Paenibacillus hemerocallicola]|jgi:molecular chaperone Hsp33|uniref:33 kDa chaperonin n=1 Tax=Paenibacillus hemerocallicola TaxID=1172614 RepID=A0A5C4T135_9BACL|nr:Hsp33 family molecular chaperone HslO [Paenibacillus hemerocallicola]TNJ62525.1 Hsp33 family molecular chaperone HslO [Paenibacillus hemerocallicola]
MQDYLIRGTAFEGKLRAFAANTTGIVEEMRRRHGTTPVATAALGRTATAGVMMGAMLKGEERLTIQVKGDGPIGQIVVDANAKGEVRGYVDNPHVDLPLNQRGKLDVAGAVGEGQLYVIKDLGLKEPYRGSIPIVSGELGEDFTYYFAKSEQTPSAVALGVLIATDYSVQASGGFIMQLLPGMDEEEIAAIEEKLGSLPPITTLLTEGADLEGILKRLVESFEVLERSEIRFQCKCSQERVEQTLLSLGRDEVEQILREDGKAEVVCHFCNETYEYNGEQLHNLVERLSKE